MTQYIEDVSACKLTLENCMELWETCRSRYLQKKVHSQLYLSGVTQKAQKSCNNAEFLRKTSGNHFDSHTYLSLLKQTSNLNFHYCLMLLTSFFALARNWARYERDCGKSCQGRQRVQNGHPELGGVKVIHHLRWKMGSGRPRLN